MAQSAPLRIGTRGSPLALWQARAVRERLAAASGRDPQTIEIKVIKTTGDTIVDRPLAEEGGKGLFTKEIEEALLRGDIDLAVHSAKDMPTISRPGLVIAACLEREDPRDAFISSKAKNIADLPHGATVGTASPRRQGIISLKRPDLKFTLLRGNVETRLRKMADGVADATILAYAGLKRLGIEDRATEVMPVHEFLPAVGQGTIAAEARENDTVTRQALAAINHDRTAVELTCERGFLAELGGSCRTAVAGYADLSGDTIHFRGLLPYLPDTDFKYYEVRNRGHFTNAAEIGAQAARWIKERVDPSKFF